MTDEIKKENDKVCVRKNFCVPAQEYSEGQKNRENFEEESEKEVERNRYHKLETGEGREMEVPEERGQIPKPDQEEVDEVFHENIERMMDEVEPDKVQKADKQEYEVKKID